MAGPVTDACIFNYAGLHSDALSQNLKEREREEEEERKGARERERERERDRYCDTHLCFQRWKG